LAPLGWAADGGRAQEVPRFSYRRMSA